LVNFIKIEKRWNRNKGVKMAKDKRVYYEWAIESVDEEGDIHNVDHSDTFPFDVLDKEPLDWERDEMWKGKVKMHYEIALKRDFHDADGYMDRSYAYMKNGVLPAEFCNGKRVPMKFHEEVARTMIKERDIEKTNPKRRGA
jgi:hypothetical protein